MKQKTRIIIYIAVAVVIVLIAVIAILLSRTGSTSEPSHLDLGRSYLLDLSYDKAILEFKEAIKFDPKNPETYIELAKAYVEIDDIPSAIETLEDGFDETGDEEIERMLNELKSLSENTPEDYDFTDSSGSYTQTDVSSETIKPDEAGSTEVNMVEVPDLSRLSEEEAKKLCEDSGFKYSISYSDSNEIEQGFVINQTIPAGTQVAEGTSIPFAVSEGSSIKVELVAENLKFDYLAEFEESGWAFAVKGSKGGYVNTSGKFVEVYDNVPPLENDYLYYWARQNGIDFMEGDGWWINIESPLKVSVEGIYHYYANNKWGYANINTGTIVVPCQYDTITAFESGRGFVGKGTYPIEYQIVDEKGNFISCEKNIGGISSSCYINNIAIVTSGSDSYDHTIIDVNGNIICEDILCGTMGGGYYPVTDSAIIFERDDMCIYSITPDLKVSKLFEYKKNEYGIYECEHPYGFMYDDYSFFSYHGEMGIVDINGNILCNNLKLTNYNYLHNGLKKCYVSDENGYYLMDVYGKRLSDHVYEAGMYAPNFSAVCKNGKWGFIDDNDNNITDFIYDNHYSTHFKIDVGNVPVPTWAIVSQNNKNLIIGTTGLVIDEFGGLFRSAYSIDGITTIVSENGSGQFNFYKVLS